MEVKNKLTVARGEAGGRQWGRKGKSQGTCIKDTWAKIARGGGRLNVEDEGGEGGRE